MSAARRMKKSYIRPAYANAVDGKVLYFPFVCIYNGHIRTNSGSAYNQVEAYIPFPSTAHPLHISARNRNTSAYADNFQRAKGVHCIPIYIPCSFRTAEFCEKAFPKKPGNVYHNNDTITARKNKKQVSTARHSGSNCPIPA